MHVGLKSNDNCSLITIQGDKEKSRQRFSWHTGMPLVSRMRLGTCLAESAIRIASRILFTSSSLKSWFNAILRNRITLSSPSLLYWGTQRLSETSSKASTENRGRVPFSTCILDAPKEFSPALGLERQKSWLGCSTMSTPSGYSEILTPAQVKVQV